MTGETAGVARAHTLRWQPIANRIVRGVLRTPLLGRAAGSRLIIVYVVGRKTGRHYAIPVAYANYEGSLLVGTPFGWARNLRTGESVDIRIKGRRRKADVRVVADEAGARALYGVLARDNHQFAKFNKIRLGADGRPDTEDLRLAWVGGARAILLSPAP